ncbi:hypothetical protein EYF80_008660 [Liparis tanakae]|uniref:Uncharacterized protein n=1 Tax=Liparis tanakae TaxID=230148 RepID=A0A4Z2ITZ5_9TELE|nr:hypothetical protein EYF80_008660 [Liparis tanakae]
MASFCGGGIQVSGGGRKPSSGGHASCRCKRQTTASCLRVTLCAGTGVELLTTQELGNMARRCKLLWKCCALRMRDGRCLCYWEGSVTGPPELEAMTILHGQTMGFKCVKCQQVRGQGGFDASVARDDCLLAARRRSTEKRPRKPGSRLILAADTEVRSQGTRLGGGRLTVG